MGISGIYTITNVINKKIYVGYAKNIQFRWYTHIGKLRRNKHDSSILQNAWNKHGEENFSFEILEECPIELMIALEHYWCTILNTHDRKFGYNCRLTNPNNDLYIPSYEIKKKIGTSNSGKNKKGMKQPESQRIKLRENSFLKGKKGLLSIHSTKEIYQYTKNGVFIRKYDYISQVSDYGFDKGCVIAVAKGRRATHKGYKWKYEYYTKL